MPARRPAVPLLACACLAALACLTGTAPAAPAAPARPPGHARRGHGSRAGIATTTGAGDAARAATPHAGTSREPGPREHAHSASSQGPASAGTAPPATSTAASGTATATGTAPTTATAPATTAPATTAGLLANAVPRAITLSSGWRLRLDPADVGLAHHWQLDRPISAWKPTTVPGVLTASLSAKAFHGTVGWYRVTFRAPPATPGFAWALSFQQVRRKALVWLNGIRLGANDDPYAPFVLPATSLRPGKLNTLVVRVDNRKGAEPREGWWNWGGITRPVTLVPQGALVTESPGLMPQLTCSAPDVCSADVLFDATVANRTPFPITPSIGVTLTPPAGGPATDVTRRAPVLAPGTSEDVSFSFPVAGTPDLWAPGHAALYAATIRTTTGTTVSQIDRLQIGLRSVTVRAGQLYLNDRPVHLSGASIEEDVPGRGPALTPADMDQIVSELQALHANVTRAQYPLSQALMDRLDRAGIMLWAQAPIYHRDELLHTPTQRAAALATLASSILQTRDHPSVITNSVANELSPTPDTTPGTRDYLLAAVARTRTLNPTLPVALDLLSYPGYPRQELYTNFQLLGINNYFGWYTGPAAHSTATIAGLAPYLRSMHRYYPDQALVMTEFGAEATFSGPATEKGTYQFQTDYILRTMAIVHKLPFVNGTVYWTLREFAVKPFWYGGGGHQVDQPRDSIHHKGLISYAGARKPAFAVLAAAYAATPLYLTPSTHRSPAPVALLLALLALVLIAGIVLFDIRQFRGLRRTGPPPGAPGAVVQLRPEPTEAQRTSTG